MRVLVAGLRERLGPAAWNALAGALPRFALLIAGIFVAQRFGAEAFARYSLAAITLALAGTLPGATLTTVASKFVPEFAQGRAMRVGSGFREIMGFATVIAVGLAVIVVAVAPALSSSWAMQPPIDALLRVAGGAALVAVIAGALGGLLVGSGRFQASALAQLAGFAAFCALLLPLARAWGIAGVIGALAALYAGAAVVSAWSARAGFAVRRNPTAVAPWRPLASFFMATLVAAGFVTPVVWLCNAILAHRESPLVALSQFNVAYQWYAVVSFAPAVLAQVEFVRMSQAKARNDTSSLPVELRRFVGRNALVMLPLVALGIGCAPLLARLYHLESGAGERAIVVMFVAAFVASLGNPAGLFLAVVDRIWLASVLNVGWGIITLAAGWVMRDFGATGIAAAFLVGHLAHALVATAVAYRLVAPRIHPT